MQIDWLTVAAQIVNFLVLIWLLQKFLYGPITRAMAQREDRIEQRLSDARKEREDARDERDALERKQADLDARREDMLEDARQEAEKLRQEREQQIDAEAEAKRSEMQDRLEAEQQDALQTIRKRAAASTFDTVRAVLSDFAGADLGDEVAARFSAHLEDLPQSEQAQLAEAASEGDADATATVECGTDLSPAAKRKLTRTIHQTVSDNLDVDYVSAPELILGLRLSVAGQTVEWSAAQHLDRLESQVRDALSAARSADQRKDAA